VPAHRGQPIRLILNGPTGPCSWRIYNVAGERVAELSFDDAASAVWTPANAAGGIYFVRVSIRAGGEERVFWQKLALL
jgi:hypothetical protein